MTETTTPSVEGDRLEAIAEAIYVEVAPLLEEHSEPNPADYKRAISSVLARLQSLSDQNRLTGGWRDEDMVAVPRAEIEKFFRLSDACSRIERPRHNLDQVGEWLCSLRQAPPLPLPSGEEKR